MENLDMETKCKWRASQWFCVQYKISMFSAKIRPCSDNLLLEIIQSTATYPTLFNNK